MRTTLSYRIKGFLRKVCPDFSLVIKIKQKKLLNTIIKDIKAKKRKIRVCFLVSDCDKWNADSLFDSMRKSDCFEPFIVITPKFGYGNSLENFGFHKDFFEKKYPIELRIGYDFEANRFIELKYFNPDIVFYQHQLFRDESVCAKNVSEYALTCYFPYPVAEPVTIIKHHRNYLERYMFKNYITHKILKKEYNKELKPKLPNLAVVGHPKLDIYFKNFKKEGKDYIIYAPHHSLKKQSLGWSTFNWSAKFMLEYAQAHPEFNWIYRPHPMTEEAVIEEGIISKEEYKEYVKEWEKIGLYYMSGDYFDLFRNSKCLITCCGSFLIEYFPSLKPVIHLRTENTPSTSSLNHAVMKTYYKAFNKEELQKHLKEILEDNNDNLLAHRQLVLKKLGLSDNKAADKIMKDLKKEFRLK